MGGMHKKEPNWTAQRNVTDSFEGSKRHKDELGRRGVRIASTRRTHHSREFLVCETGTLLLRVHVSVESNLPPIILVHVHTTSIIIIRPNEDTFSHVQHLLHSRPLAVREPHHMSPGNGPQSNFSSAHHLPRHIAKRRDMVGLRRGGGGL